MCGVEGPLCTRCSEAAPTRVFISVENCIVTEPVTGRSRRRAASGGTVSAKTRWWEPAWCARGSHSYTQSGMHAPVGTRGLVPVDQPEVAMLRPLGEGQFSAEQWPWL